MDRVGVGRYGGFGVFWRIVFVFVKGCGWEVRIFVLFVVFMLFLWLLWRNLLGLNLFIFWVFGVNLIL